MEAGSLTIYSASAGSGKTFKLAGAYLEMLFKSRFSYRHILAVTFTNKATTEMKRRILDELDNLATGRDSKYLINLTEKTGKDEKTIRSEAGIILSLILHDFSRFSVNTIDSFFQKILRSFAKDIGLQAGFDIVLDHNTILSYAVDNMIASASSDIRLKNWLSEYVRTNIEDEKTWDLKQSIMILAEELFSERFKLLSAGERDKIQNKEFLLSYIRELRSLTSDFENQMKEYGLRCISLISDFGIDDDAFFQKSRGVPAFIRSMIDGSLKPPNKYVLEINNDPPKWSSGNMPESLDKALKAGLEKALKDAILYFNSHITDYKSARVILSNIFALGILSDILNQVHHFINDENIFLLAEAGEMIYLITEKDQTPFIYEKAGNTFDVFMIDEFQDTSILQWKNLRILIENSISQGSDNMVVGDIKQSIYRWRNSDWRILGDLRTKADNRILRSESLKTNWRSCTNIIRFNNSLFSSIPRQIDEELKSAGSMPPFTDLYAEAKQNDPCNKADGFIRLEFIANSDNMKWEDMVLERLPSLIESIQDKGYSSSDIGILVRNNNEGSRVLKKVISYSNNCPAVKKKIYNYNIISNDSLLLCNSPALIFILAALTVIDNPDNMIARALMLRYYLFSTGKEDTVDLSLLSDELTEYSKRFYPEGYSDFLENARYLPLYNITEEIIRFFSLGDYSYNVAYLNSFQDLVLNYSADRNIGIAAFLDWWEAEGSNKSLSLPEEQEAIRVLTIHKAKGLEFRVVILPFLSWNLDHKSNHSNILWLKPEIPPFNKLGIVPVKYKKGLEETIFAREYFNERYSAYLDNINLLYVAFTRAQNAIYGFAPEEKDSDRGIGSVIFKALTSPENFNNNGEMNLNNFFEPETNIFEYGSIPVLIPAPSEISDIKITDYPVFENIESLRLKMHGTEYLLRSDIGNQDRINYGKLMHELFEGIITKDDLHGAIVKLVLDGKISMDKASAIEMRIKELLSKPLVSEWFDVGNEVFTEAAILMPLHGTRRPDRIVFRDGRIIIVDFKFGYENSRNISQIQQYRSILTGMGYKKIEAYLWYVDTDKIISA